LIPLKANRAPALEANTEAVELFAGLLQGLPVGLTAYLRMAPEDRVTVLTAIGDRQEDLVELKKLPGT
jgi:hypothetical protein